MALEPEIKITEVQCPEMETEHSHKKAIVKEKMQRHQGTHQISSKLLYLTIKIFLQLAIILFSFQVTNFCPISSVIFSIFSLYNFIYSAMKKSM